PATTESVRRSIRPADSGSGLTPTTIRPWPVDVPPDGDPSAVALITTRQCMIDLSIRRREMFATKTAAESRQHRWWTLVVLCLSVFLVVVDNTIVNTALPTLARELHAGTSELQWIVDAYTLAVAGLLLVGGALGDRYGRHRLLAGGLAVLGLGAALAALSSTARGLVAPRALRGGAAATITPATLSILSDVFENPSERVKAIGIWSGTSGLGVAVGPTLSGWLLEHFSWSSVFFVHVPIVIIALIAGRVLVPTSRADRRPRLDPVGAVLSLAALVA